MATQAALAGADDDDVASARELVVAFLEERYPDLSVRAGPLADLAVGPATDALAAVDVRAAADAAALDPETALAGGSYDEDVLTAALAGRGVTRGAAEYATGSIAIHLSSVTGVTVPGGYRAYTADGVYYAVDSARRVLAPGSTAVSDSDVVAVTVPSGGYAVVVGATAVEIGETANRPAGTSLTSATTLSGQTAVYVAIDFTGGSDAESDAALLARLPSASAARTASSRAGAEAVVRDAVSAYSDVTTIGFGHEGMDRGRSALTGQTPGRLDVRVRTGSAPSRVRVPVTATLIATSPFGRWRFELGVDDAPGRFLIEKVIQENAALSATGYATASVTTGYDTDDDETGVDVRTAADAAQSRYATATVEFLDPDTSTSGLTVDVSTRDYDAIVRTVYGIDTAQAAVDASGARAAGGDCLVRSACPVMVEAVVNLTIQSGAELTAYEAAAAVAAAINDNGISSSLSWAQVAARAAALLPAGTALQLGSWSGTVYPTGGSAYAASGSTDLTVATDWDLGVGPDTVAFYADVETIDAGVSSV